MYEQDSGQLRLLTAACAAHRVCCGVEADSSNGKIHGYCVVCGVPWPCATAAVFMDAVKYADR